MFGLVGISPVPLPAGYSSGLFILVILLRVIVAFLYSGNLWSSLYYEVILMWVGLYQWLVKVSWLGRLVLEFWWVELDFFSLECNEVTSNGL